MTSTTVPVEFDDPVNTAILAVSEDQLTGFQRDPLGEIARRSGIDPPVVVERIQEMLKAGTIRRVRQTLQSVNLAHGALVAWRVLDEELNAAFDFILERDPFSGHVVIRTTEAGAPGSEYKLWTTLKVPPGYSIDKHAGYLAAEMGAESYRLMPAKRVFALGVGHLRRRGLQPGSKSDELPEPTVVEIVELSETEWRVLTALKREFSAEEIVPELWAPRAEEAGVSLQSFLEVAESLDRRNVIGRFSTFLEHVKAGAGGESVTGHNALYQWAVPPGREIEAGREIGRHEVLTHAYWRETGPEFANVSIMAVAHGTEKALLLEHKAAIDAHLDSVGIPVSYTNVFWGGRSEIKPSEISPVAYRQWCESVGLDPEEMRG